MNLGRKSIILAGSIILVAFAVTAFFIGEKMTQSARKTGEELALSKAENNLHIVQSEIEEICRQSEMIAKAISFISFAKDFSLVEEILQLGFVQASEIGTRWFIEIKNQKINGIVLKRLSNSVATRSIVNIHEMLKKDLKSLRKTSLSQPYKNDQGKALISIMSPIFVNSKLSGVVGFDIDLRKFQQVFYNVESFGKAYVSIISKNGICIVHPDENLIGKQVGNYQDSGFVQLAFQTGEKQQKKVHSEFLNLQVMRIYQPSLIGEGVWLITASVPLFNVRESVIKVRNSVLWIGLLLATLLMIFLYFSKYKWMQEFLQRQHAESEHKNVLLKLSSIMENSDQIVIFSVDKDYQCTSFNSACKEEIRKQEGKLIALEKNLLDMYDSEFRIEMKKHLDRALAGEHFLVEYRKNNIHYQQIFNAISNERGDVVGVSSFCIDISETVQLRQKARAEKEEKVRAQLKNLQNQINPHFLFNSLNSLFALIEEEPNLAREFIVNLSKVYRYLLYNNNSEPVALKAELDFVKHYLFLQKIRFGNYLNMKIDVASFLLQKRLPSVSLQSLVENAIKHNVITAENPLTIKIYTNEKCQLLVENKFQPRNDSAQSLGVGLKNLETRYLHMGNQSLKYGVHGNCFRVVLPLL